MKILVKAKRKKDEKNTANGLVIPKNSTVKEQNDEANTEPEEERKDGSDRSNGPEDIQRDLNAIKGDIKNREAEESASSKTAKESTLADENDDNKKEDETTDLNDDSSNT